MGIATLGPCQRRADGKARAHAQRAEGARVQPAQRRARVQHVAGGGHEVAAVGDEDGVVAGLGFDAQARGQVGLAEPEGLVEEAARFARQQGAALYGAGGGSGRFQASALLGAQNAAQKASNSFRAQTTDPYALAQQRQAVLMQGYDNPLADQVRGWIPGLEAQRQNNNFWSQLAGVGSQILPYVTGGGVPNLSGLGGRGGGKGQYVGNGVWL